MGHIKDPEPRIAEKAAFLASLWDACQPHFVALQAEQQRRATGGQMSWRFFRSVDHVFRNAKATPAERSRALEIAREVVEKDANGPAARVRALEFIAEHAPDARVFIERFTDDKLSTVRLQAQKLLKKQLKQ